MRKRSIVNHKRPINLSLRSLNYPPMAIVSILHRISGLFIFLLMPIMLYFLSLSLHSEDSFVDLQAMLLNPFSKFIIWSFSTAFVYHVIAGIRHLFMDLGFGEQVNVGRQTAIVVIVLAVISTLLLGIWIW